MSQTNKPPRVFITQDNGVFDLKKLDRFGTLVTLFETSIRPTLGQERVDNMVERARRVFKDFDSTRDYLCLVGDVAVIALCSFVLADELAGEPVRMLRFDKPRGEYFEICIRLPVEA